MFVLYPWGLFIPSVGMIVVVSDHSVSVLVRFCQWDMAYKKYMEIAFKLYVYKPIEANYVGY